MITEEILSDIIKKPVYAIKDYTNPLKHEIPSIGFDTDSTNGVCISTDMMTGKTTYPGKSINIHQFCDMAIVWAQDSLGVMVSLEYAPGSFHKNTNYRIGLHWTNTLEYFTSKNKLDAIFEMCKYVYKEKQKR